MKPAPPGLKKSRTSGRKSESNGIELPRNIFKCGVSKVADISTTFLDCRWFLSALFGCGPRTGAHCGWSGVGGIRNALGSMLMVLEHIALVMPTVRAGRWRKLKRRFANVGRHGVHRVPHALRREEASFTAVASVRMVTCQVYNKRVCTSKGCLPALARCIGLARFRIVPAD